MTTTDALEQQKALYGAPLAELLPLSPEVRQKLLALDDPPDAVFCFTDELALGAMRVAWERGVRVPDDLALVGSMLA